MSSKELPRRVVRIVAALALMLPIGCATSPSKSPSKSPTKEPMAFALPDGWRVTEQATISPEILQWNVTAPGTSISTVIMRYPLAMSRDRIAEVMRSSMIQSCDDAKLVSGPYHLGSVEDPAYETYSGSRQGHALRIYLAYNINKDSGRYCLTAVGTPDEMESFEDDLIAITSSFH